MDAFDTYFRTLGLLLPRAQRDDIIRELSEEMRSQVAELESSRGRALTADEQAELLSQMGHPLLTAARYRPARSLIGPVVFPYYWLLLEVLLALVTLGHVLAAIVLVAADRPAADFGALAASLVETVLKIVGWITALAAVADAWLTRSRVLERWKPAATGALRKEGVSRIERAFAALPGSTTSTPVSVSGFLVMVLISAWWLTGLKLPWVFFGGGAAMVGWGPAMDRVYPVLVFAQAAFLAEYFVSLTRLDPGRVRQALRIAWLIGGWLLAYLVVTSNHDWMVWQNAVESSGGADRVITIAGRTRPLLDVVNYLLSSIFVAVTAAGVARSAMSLLRWLRRKPSVAAA